MKIKRRKIKIKRRDLGKIYDASSVEVCTKRQRDIIYEAIKAGLPIIRAVELAGITVSQHYNWMKMGLDKKNKKFYQYRKAIIRFRARREKEALEVIRSAQNGGQKIKEVKVHIGGKYGREVTRIVKTTPPKWHAAAWYLERLYPEQYALKTKDDDSNKTPEEFAKQILDSINQMDQSVPDYLDEE